MLHIERLYAHDSFALFVLLAIFSARLAISLFHHRQTPYIFASILNISYLKLSLPRKIALITMRIYYSRLDIYG